MNANKKAKQDEVKIIADKLAKSQALVVIEYSKMTVKDFQALRKDMKAKDVELVVYKNRLFKIAADNAGFKELGKDLNGQNAYAFGYSDDMAPAKVIANFAKTNEAVKFKVGIYEKRVIDAKEVALVATLPTFEEALTILATQMLSPVKFVGVGLHQLIEEGKITA